MKSIVNTIGDSTPAGIVLNMPRHEYDRIERLNMSSISCGLLDHEEVDTLAIKYRFEGEPEHVSQSTKDLRDSGTLAHIMMLQPERLESDVAVWEGEERRGQQWTQFLQENRSRLVVRRKDFDEVSAACREFRFNPQLNELFRDLDVEVAVFSDEHGIKTKGLIDAVSRGDFCRMLDIKTTWTRIKSQAVRTSIRTFHNREKMAAYSRWYERESGRKIDRCLNIYLQMTPPYGIRIVHFSEAAIEWGTMRMMDAVRQVRACIDSGKWPVFCGKDLADVAEFEMPVEGEQQLDWD